MKHKVYIIGGAVRTSQNRKGGNGTGLTSFLPRLPKGGLRCEGEVTHRG